MSLEKIVDARLDPRTVTMNDVVLTEKYTVTKIDDLVDAYGFSLSETPVKKSGAQATISSVTYVDGNGVRVSLTEQSIGSINLLPNQFMCNYGTTLAQPEINRNYRIGQIFVNGVLDGEEITVVYRALGSNSSSDVFNRLVDDKIKEKLPTPNLIGDEVLFSTYTSNPSNGSTAMTKTFYGNIIVFGYLITYDQISLFPNSETRLVLSQVPKNVIHTLPTTGGDTVAEINKQLAIFFNDKRGELYPDQEYRLLTRSMPEGTSGIGAVSRELIFLRVA